MTKFQNIPSIQEIDTRARELFATSSSRMTDYEKKEQRAFGIMVENPSDKCFVARIIDESSQIRSTQALARRIKRLIDRYGIPTFLSPIDLVFFWLYQKFAFLPPFNLATVPIIKWRIRRYTRRIVFNDVAKATGARLSTAKHQWASQNVNIPGETTLGNEEAERRLASYIKALQQTDINCISVKLSSIYAQNHPLNYNESLPELVRRMTLLYRAAIDNKCTDNEGKEHDKFVYLDMEEYKDAHLTMRVFLETLSQPEFANYKAGIVVQAYLPDAWDFQTELLDFAHKRVDAGGAPVYMRLVKGSYLDWEIVNSDLRGWENPVRRNKIEVDANYLHLLERALEPDNARVLRVGIASHNLFTIAYANILAKKYRTPVRHFHYEMFEGMANHVCRAQVALGNNVLQYVPVIGQEQFCDAASYLMRRMDENTAPDNFLANSFTLKPDTVAWDKLLDLFKEAYRLKDNLTHKPQRIQNRNDIYMARVLSAPFSNEPDTDFSRCCNREWVERIIKQWKPSGNATEREANWDSLQPGSLVPTQIGRELKYNEDPVTYYDRSQSNSTEACRMSRATTEQAEAMLKIAQDDPSCWRQKGVEERNKILLEAANNLGLMRADLIGAMCSVTGKTIEDADKEVSEAMDYCRYYPSAMSALNELEGVEMRGKGTVLVISPRNAPCAMPCGGAVAALASGNTCILKPATEAAPVAWLTAKALWRAGVPREALQVVLPNDEAADTLITSPLISHIILSGSAEQAKSIAAAAPHTPLTAETGGKNAIILTDSGDRDHAILNVCRSAFGNAGQKSSACSLFLVQRSAYNEPGFLAKLRDCAMSIKTGGVWQTGNMVGPMITNTNERLDKALQLEQGEQWLIEPEYVDEEHYMLRPCIKIGVSPDSYTFKTVLLAPLLAVVPFDSLQEAIDMVNSLDCGLTSGLQSLDEKEHAIWKDGVKAGNIYINRDITGDIVGRQPFGGTKQSAFGPELKAGGPNYCMQFMTISDKAGSLADYCKSFSLWYQREFKYPRMLCPSIRGEQNLLRYLPLTEGGMVLRLFGNEDKEDIKMVVCAAAAVGTKLTISVDLQGHCSVSCPVNIVKESLADLCLRLHRYERIRTLTTDVPDELVRAAEQAHVHIAMEKPVRNGRIELVRYLREQTISYEYHRYGSIIEVPRITEKNENIQ